MDADTLRITLAVVGALAIAGLYLWERRRSAPREDDDLEGRKQEPSLGAWTEGGGKPAQAGLAADAGDWSEGEAGQLDLPYEPEQTEFALKPPPAPEPPKGPMILTLHIAAKRAPFEGPELVQTAARFGLEPGEMDIFHCSLGEDEDRQTLFSMANMVKPGTFPFDAMEEFRTPGLTLFAQLDGTHDDPGRMEEMLGTAHSLADALGGEVRDEGRRRLTVEAERRLRERVMAFVRAKLAQPETA